MNYSRWRNVLACITRYPYRYPRFKVDASHARFNYDPNRCVLCTRCMRACERWRGARTWNVMGRGIHSVMITDLHQPWGESPSCTLVQQVRPRLSDRGAQREGCAVGGWCRGALTGKSMRYKRTVKENTLAFNLDSRTKISTFTVATAIALWAMCLPAWAGEPPLSWQAYNG